MENFPFKGNPLSSLPNSVKLSHGWVLTRLKYQEIELYAIVFDEYK